jgi:hypothetical protein
LPIFGRFGRPLRRTSTPSGARRGPWAAARPRRGRPGPVGGRRGDLCVAVGAVGRQRAICPRLVSGGPQGEVPAHSTPRQLVEAAVEAARRPRAVPAGRSDPPACYRDQVGPALAPQTRPEGTQALLWGTCRRGFLTPRLGSLIRPIGGFPRRTSTPSGARRGPWAAARPRRGRPGPVGARRGDLCVAVRAVGRQRAICPRLVSGGPQGEVPAHSTPRQLVEAAIEAARRPRAVPAGRSDPPACYRDQVRPALAPQTPGPWVAARPLRGRPGPVGARRDDHSVCGGGGCRPAEGHLY